MIRTFGNFINLEQCRKDNRQMVCAAQDTLADKWMQIFLKNGSTVNGVQVSDDNEIIFGKHADGKVFIYDKYNRKMYVESSMCLPLLFGKAAVL